MSSGSSGGTSTKLLLQKFIKLDRIIKQKEGDLESLKEERIPLERELISRFESAGLASMKSVGGVTVYVRRDIWASNANPADHQHFIECIKALSEMANLVHETVNAQTLSAVVREHAKSVLGESLATATPEEIAATLPEVLRGVVKVTDKFSLRTRKG
jgi:hypothetical protein